MRSRSLRRDTLLFAIAISAFLFCATAALAQSTGFTYQGRLTDGGTAANGNYDLQFALFDSASGGTQVGSTQTLNPVAVSNGVFTVSLDFGANAFPGASRFLEISARPSGSASFTLLSPRQQITSTPYAVRSLSAATADNVPAATVINATTQYNLNGSRILGAPGANNVFAGTGAGAANLTGSSNAFFGSNAGAANTTGFQNAFFGSRAGQANTTGAANAFFGNGAGAANTSSDNAFFGNQAGGGNTTGFGNAFFGSSAGQANTTGNENSFFGRRAGESNTTGERNTFVGSMAGLMNTGLSADDNTFVGFEAGKLNTGGFNSFFGSRAGQATTTGGANAFFGSFAGLGNTTGAANSFFGSNAGNHNTTGIANSFFGSSAGYQNTTGNNNVFVGDSAGTFTTTGSSNTFVGGKISLGGGFVIFTGGNNTTGSKNTLIGSGTDVFSDNLNNATAIGAHARVDQSNSLVLGSINGVNDATANTNVGIGTTTPQRRLHIRGTGSDGPGNGDLLVTGTGTTGSAITLEATGSGGHRFSWISTASGADPGGGALAAFDVTGAAYRMVINSTGNVGIGTTSPTATLSVNGTANKPGGGSWGVFSDARLKNIHGRFTPGLKAVMQLQPLRYEYKRDNALNLKSEGEHVGFSAQAVQKIIPEAVSTTDNGYLLVNNDPILWTMLNAIKEQQAQIAKLQQVNSAMRARLHKVERALKKKSSARRR